MHPHHQRIIFVTGGVLSSLGKGVIAGALGALLEQQNLKVTIVKLDPYLNIDAGTMSPFQHGEVFVTADGAETDLDLGTYERFLNRPMSSRGHVTAGRVFQNVIARERQGDYLGSTVQVIPHITDEIKKQILNQDPAMDIIIVEVGGTVGDIESQPFLEAIRQLCFEITHTLCIHVTLVPYVATSGELKTKPTQHSVKELLSMGLRADLLVCRSSMPLGSSERAKLALFSNLQQEEVFESPDVNSIYELPMILYEQGLVDVVLKKLGFPEQPIHAPLLWDEVAYRIKHPEKNIEIAMVGKYSALTDAYKSINEGLLHAALNLNAKVNITYIPAEKFENEEQKFIEVLKKFDGVLVPGGFGDRGVEGKILAAKICREHNIPYFGICLGMQLAVVEFCRHILMKPLANSAEFAPASPDLVFNLITEFQDLNNNIQTRNSASEKGGTMRLGSYCCALTAGTKVAEAYQNSEVFERHRHRFELNPIYIADLEKSGFTVAGRGPMELVEVMELKSHPWFIGTQYHPEFQSTPLAAHPLFVGFIAASMARKAEQE